MIKVIFIVDGLYGGGKERQLVELINGLSGTIFSVGVITFSKHQHYSEVVQNMVEYFWVLHKRPNKLAPFFSIWRCFAEFHPDIVHTWDSLSSLYAYLPAKKFRCKLIDGSIRDAGVEKGWEFALKRMMLKKADLCISNSFAGLSYYRVKGEVVYNAIDLKRFIKQTPSHDFNVIMAASFSEYKDHDTFFNAIIPLLQDNIVDNAYLLGDGERLDYYKSLIQDNHNEIAGRVHFKGRVRNVEEYLAKCKVGILCSTIKYGEGVSNSILEYLASGVVCIATNIGGTSEIITDKENGFLINPNDSGEIIKIITRIHNKDINLVTVIEAGYRIVKEKFSYEANIARLKKIYEQIH